MNIAQSVPRFLLPRLSWVATTPTTSYRASSVLLQRANQRQNPWQQARPTWRGVTETVSHRAFHASPARRRDHHFDTLKFVQRLEEEGFTEEQAVAMMKVLNDVIEER